MGYGEKVKRNEGFGSVEWKWELRSKKGGGGVWVMDDWESGFFLLLYVFIYLK